MPVFTQRSLTGGEIAPALHARADMSKYQTSLATALNTFVHVEGGISNRTGFEFIAEVYDSTVQNRLIEFEFSTEQAYALEFGNNTMRVIKDAGQVLETAQTINSITQANPAVVNATAHLYTNGEEVYIDDGGDMTEVNSKNFIVDNVTANTFEIKDLNGNFIDSTAYTAYTGGGEVSRVYTIATPYAEDVVSLLRFTQSADTMTLVEAQTDPTELTRTDHDSWAFTAINFTPVQAAPTALGLTPVGTASGSNNKTYEYVVTAVNSDGEESLQSASISNSINAMSVTYGNQVTWTPPAAAPGTTIEHYNIYKAESYSANIYGYIGQSNTTTFEDFNLGPDMFVGPPTDNDPFSGADDNPTTVNYYQQRIVYGSTTNQPQTVFTSETGNYHSMRSHQPVIDSDSLQFTLASKKVNRIRHIVALDALLVLTSGGEWKITEGADDVLTPSTVGFKQQSYNGASNIEPLVIDSNALYIQDKGARVRDIGYTFESDSYTGSDLTVLARHLFEEAGVTKQVVDWTFQKEPYGVVWAVMSDGTFLSFTYQREQQVWAWCRHNTDGEMESVCSIPEGTEDALYAIIKRTINGTDKRYIERLHSRQMGDVTDAFFVDCGLSYDTPSVITGATQTNPVVVTDVNHPYTNGQRVHLYNVGGMTELSPNGMGRYLVNNVTTHTYELQTLSGEDVDGTAFTEFTVGGEARAAITTITNLDHIEGKAVACLNDGAVVRGLTVSGGEVILPDPGGKVHIGLGFTSDIETLDIDSAERTVRHVKKSVAEVNIAFSNSRGGWVGPDFDSLTEFKSRGISDGYGIIPLRTRTERIVISPKWSEGGRTVYRQVDPLPFTILAITPEFDAA